MRNNDIALSGNIVDVFNSKIYPGTIAISNGKIADIIKEKNTYSTYILPGFIDSHFHIESSMLVPSELSKIAAVHGTTAILSDPHEIANVLGINGVQYMIDNAKSVSVKFYFGAPSCVPASEFETSGAVIGPDLVEELLKRDEIKYLAEVMNFPGVINSQPDVMRKIGIAKRYGKVIDGHSPELRGEGLWKYVKAGISTDHECFQKDEALEKIGLGMNILIREGSAAKNFDELIPIVEKHFKHCMFCSDDRHPDDLLKGHINEMVKRAVAYGIDVMKVLRVACVNPVLHYGLDAGLLRVGNSADFIVVDNLKDFHVLQTYINGEIVSNKGKSLIDALPPKIVNKFTIGKKNIDDFNLPSKEGRIHVIEAIDGQVITEKGVAIPYTINGNMMSDINRDILKIAVVNRYLEAKPAIGFIKNFGLKKGAIASSVAHDSHNIIAVGVTDEDICRAVNLIIEHKGGICAVSREKEIILPLPVAGIMSSEEPLSVAEKYTALDRIAKELGSILHAPFMTLSFMALLVIPKIKLSDKGLFDGEKFEYIDLQTCPK